MTTQNSEEGLNKIVIQGIKGAFHEIAARQFYPAQGLAIRPAHTFDELVSLVEAGDKVSAGIMAIENSIAGSLLYNYQLLSRSSLTIAGEIYLRIKHNLMCMPGVGIEQLKEVHSHPMALAQCRQFFEAHPGIKLISTEDTALSARRIKEKNWQRIGAIASSLAAGLYGLDIVAAGIETNKKNYTRFLILQREDTAVAGLQTINKATICFTLKHEIGSLHRVLAELAVQQANLTKIESSPILGGDWQYRFFIDFMFEPTIDPEQVIDAIRPMTDELKVLGKYSKGIHYED